MLSLIVSSASYNAALHVAQFWDGRAKDVEDQAKGPPLNPIEMAMADWTLLLSHANEAAAKETWELPPEELFQRILVQINRSKRDILQEKYNACLDPNCPPQTRSVFIRVLKRIAESFMTCLLQMQSGQNGFGQHGAAGSNGGAAAAGGGPVPVR